MRKFIMVLSLVLVFSFTGCSIDNSPIEERNFITTDDLISTKDLNKLISDYLKEYVGSIAGDNAKEQYKVAKSDFPAESSACKALFPRKLLKELESISYDWLRKDVNNQAEEYFNKNNINMAEN